MARSIIWSVIFFARVFNLDAEGDQDIKTTMNSGCDAQSLHGDGAPIRVTFQKINVQMARGRRGVLEKLKQERTESWDGSVFFQLWETCVPYGFSFQAEVSKKLHVPAHDGFGENKDLVQGEADQKVKMEPKRGGRGFSSFHGGAFTCRRRRRSWSRRPAYLVLQANLCVCSGFVRL